MAGQQASPPVLQAQRAVFENVLSPEECRELVFILKSCGVVGYRPHVISCTPLDLIASNSAELVLPLLNAAVRVQQLVETRFERECELFLEFVGLISWQPGASIGWHSDSNREYLKQRHYSAVCYLNDQGADFAGGTFRFRNAEPRAVEPLAGRVVAYSSGEENTHCVDPVTARERTTLALWFTADPDHSTDAILLPQLRSALHRALSSAPGGTILAAAPYPIDPPDTFFVEPEAWARGNLGGTEGGWEKRGAEEGLGVSREAGFVLDSERKENSARSAAEEECEKRCCDSSATAKKRRRGEAAASPTRGVEEPLARARHAQVEHAAASFTRGVKERVACAFGGQASNGSASAKETADGVLLILEGRGMTQEGRSDGGAFREDGGACREDGPDNGTGPVSDANELVGKKPSTASDVGRSDGADCSKVEKEEDLRNRRLSELGLRFVLDRRRESFGKQPGTVTGLSADRHVSEASALAIESGDIASGLPVNPASNSKKWFEESSETAPGSLTSTEAARGSPAEVRPGVPSTGHSEAEADDQREEPGDDGAVRLQWLDGKAFEGEFQSKAHALQVLHYFELCVEAQARPADAAGSTKPNPGTGLVTDGLGNGGRCSVNERPRKWREAGRTASELWDTYTLLKWQHLQVVLEQWSASGLFGVDCLSL